MVVRRSDRSKLLGVCMATVAWTGCTRQGGMPPYGESAPPTSALTVEPSATVTNANPPAVEPDMPGPAATSPPGSLTMKSLVSHGYGCGGHCAFNWHGQSTVALVWSADGQARVSDQGTADFSQSDPGGYSDTTRTWAFLWLGTWTGSDTRRTVDVQQVASSCNVSVDARNQATKGTCPSAPQNLQLVCEWGSIPRDEERRAANPAPTTGSAWTCRGEPSLGEYPGTELPWVFSPVTLERRLVGEPEPETTYVPWREPAPNAAP